MYPPTYTTRNALCVYTPHQLDAPAPRIGGLVISEVKQIKKPGRPREWVLNEEIIEIHKLSHELKTQHPAAHRSTIKEMLKARLDQMNREELLSKVEKLWGLISHNIPIPPRCICGRKSYSYTYRKVENEREHRWEIFARCTHCRYLRRYLPASTYIWSRKKSIIKELEKIPTFYEMDGQKVESAK